MANFMTREKEFRKLNEKLDDDFKRSTALGNAAKGGERHQNPEGGICYDTYRVDKVRGGHNNHNNHNHNNSNMSKNTNNNDRFATYSKENRATLDAMRKVGGGDGAIMPIKPQSPMGPRPVKTNYGNTFNYRAKSLPKGANAAAAAIDDINGYSGGQIINNSTNSSRAMAQLTAKSKPSTSKGTLLIYKNDKFTNSSSIDDLIKRSLLEEAKTEQNVKGDDKQQERSISKNHINKHTMRADESTLSMQSMERACGNGGVRKNSQKFVNTSSLIRFLNSKVSLLEENQARNMEEMSKQKEAYEELVQRQKSMTQQLDKTASQNQSLTEQLEYANTQLMEAQRRNREQSQECLALRKENEATKREFKRVTLNFTNMEKRFQRTKEDLENAQQSCTLMRQNDRDMKEHYQRDVEAKNAEIKYLKKQRLDLINAYKKQLFLIDNLKQQNACLEQAKMIDFCEKEFSKILEWN